MYSLKIILLAFAVFMFVLLLAEVCTPIVFGAVSLAICFTLAKIEE